MGGLDGRVSARTGGGEGKRGTGRVGGLNDLGGDPWKKNSKAGPKIGHKKEKKKRPRRMKKKTGF